MRDERRLVGRVLRHWTKTVHAKGFPRRGDIDPWMLGEDWANCLLIAVESPIELSHFIAVGENLAIALRPNDTLAGVLLSLVPRVVSAHRGLTIEGGATIRSSPILFRSVLLPLSEDGVAIDHVLGATNHRALRAGESASREAVRTLWL
jgi:hypothetical protein